LEHTTRERVETVVEGLLADQEETIRLLEADAGARPGAEDDESHEQREDEGRAQMRHTDTVRLPRPPMGAYDWGLRWGPTARRSGGSRLRAPSAGSAGARARPRACGGAARRRSASSGCLRCGRAPTLP